MKQFQIRFTTEKRFLSEIGQIKRYSSKIVDSKLLFHLSFVNASDKFIHNLIKTIKTEFPTALYYGNESFGNICNGNLDTEQCLITCTVFEHEGSNIELVTIRADDVQKDNPLETLWKEAKTKQNLKAIEIISTLSFSVTHNLIEAHVDLPIEVKVFGGVSINSVNINSPSLIFSSACSISITDCIAVLYCGQDLNVECSTVSGWKGLGRWMTVTKSKENTIYQIDGFPAMNIYRKYLGLSTEIDKYLYQSWFPLVIEKDGIEMIRSIAQINKDESITTLLAIAEGSKVRLSYGDHSSILVEVDDKATDLAMFEPEIIRVFSCASRRIFWGDEGISQETELLEEIGSTSGFYTAGELLRAGEYLYEFNATIVLACMREGEAIGENRYFSKFNLGELTSTRNARLVSFITAVTDDLEMQFKETYKALITDILTGIGNRYAYETYRKQLIKNKNFKNLIVLSADVNGLKTINDTIGHEGGDELISGAANVLKEAFGEYGHVFRVGGDEFIGLIFADNLNEIKEHFFTLMKAWKGKNIEKLFIAVGAAEFNDFPDLSFQEIEKIADQRMYDAKRNYYIENHIERRRQ